MLSSLILSSLFAVTTDAKPNQRTHHAPFHSIGTGIRSLTLCVQCKSPMRGTGRIDCSWWNSPAE